jgi:hypothetical protein
MAPGARDPAVLDSAWFQIDLRYEACVGSLDLVFYSAGWGPTEVLLQSSNNGVAWSDVQHISIALDDVTPQTEFDGETFAEPRYVFGSAFESRRARFLRLVCRLRYKI